MTELTRLKSAVKNYHHVKQTFKSAREELRESVRMVLVAKTAARGDQQTLADSLGDSQTRIASIKLGYAAPSAEWAEKLIRVCEES